MMTRQDRKKTEVSNAERKREEAEMKRASILFKRRTNVIAPNDIVTNLSLKKIKLESDSNPPIIAVKEENITTDDNDIVDAGTFTDELILQSMDKDEVEMSGSPGPVYSQQPVQENLETTEALKYQIEQLSAEVRELKNKQALLKDIIVEQVIEIKNLRASTHGSSESDTNNHQANNNEQQGSSTPTGHFVDDKLQPDEICHNDENEGLVSVNDQLPEIPSLICRTVEENENNMESTEVHNESERQAISGNEQNNLDTFLEDAILEIKTKNVISYYDMYFGNLEYDDKDVEDSDGYESDDTGESDQDDPIKKGVKGDEDSESLNSNDYSDNEDDSKGEEEAEKLPKDEFEDTSDEEWMLTSENTTESESDEEDIDSEYFGKKLQELKHDERIRLTEESPAKSQEEFNNERKIVSTIQNDSLSAGYLNELRNIYTFTDKEGMKAFAWASGNSLTNPFVGRSVKFIVTTDSLQMEDILSKEKLNLVPPESTSDIESHLRYFNDYKKYCTLAQAKSLEFWNCVAEFLVGLGKHIWELTLVQEDCGLTPVFLLKIIILCLEHTPNLKKLVVDGSFSKILFQPKTRSEWQLRHRVSIPTQSQPLKVVFNRKIDIGDDRRKRNINLWWHSLIIKRVKEAKEFVVEASVPKFLNLRTIELNMKEYLPEYTIAGCSIQGHSICNYIFFKYKKIMSAGLWSNLSALDRVRINFEKIYLSDVNATDFRPNYQFFLRTWIKGNGCKFKEEDSEGTQRMNPVPKPLNSHLFKFVW